MGQKINVATGKMTHLCRKMVHVNIKWGLLRRILRYIWGSIIGCSRIRKPNSPAHYRRIGRRNIPAMVDEVEIVEMFNGYESDSDLVHLKISLLGDCQIGKTSFLIKYVGEEQERKSLEMKGLNLMDKVMIVSGARIASTMWDVTGDSDSVHHVPIACKDATAIPILIGTKFDDFIRLPPNLQCAIVTQARAYAKAMKATLFFSSATHNINVNKIFKFIMAKLFNLPWPLDRNLTAGEPIVDY
ncbi:hypothetical protein KSS87_019285 [Heliosperma pusillum]|nr:hypothetical protein KSS87_019285 [Heliosperma pusillum]